MMLHVNNQTPCGVMFSLLKRYGGITHQELASLILSERPLPSGKTPTDMAKDRSWLSHSVVHAPAGSVQERFFRDYGSAAVRVMGRLKSRRGRALDAEEIVSMLTGEHGREMDRALELCHEDAHLYRNALMRFASEHGYAPGERAEAVLVLFVAVGCSANVKKSVAYAMDYASASFGHRASTPATEALARPDGSESAEKNLELGLLRVKDGYVAGVPHWLPRSVGGIEIGSLVMGENDITDVGVGVSGRHVRVWHADKDGEKDGWLVEDLGSKNGTVLVSGADHARTRVVPGVPVSLRPGDELELAGDTSFIAIEGTLS